EGGRILAGLKERQTEIQVDVRERRIEGPNGFEFSGGVSKAPIAIGKQPSVIVLACAVFRGGAREQKRPEEGGAGGSARGWQTLKYQLQRQLNLARRAHTGDATEWRRRADRRTGHVLRRNESRVDAGKLRVIENIEEFAAELQLGTLAALPEELWQIKVFEERKIEIVDAGRAHVVAGGITERSRRLQRKCPGIEVIQNCSLALVEVGRRNHVGPLADRAAIGESHYVVVDTNRPRKSRSSGVNTHQFPPAKRSLNESVGA